MFAYMLTFNPRSKATNIPYLSFCGLTLAAGVEITILLEDLGNLQKSVFFKELIFEELILILSL